MLAAVEFREYEAARSLGLLVRSVSHLPNWVMMLATWAAESDRPWAEMSLPHWSACNRRDVFRALLRLEPLGLPRVLGFRERDLR